MNGAVWLQSCTSSSSTGSTSSTTWLQLLCGCRSGARPPASIAVPVAIRSGEAEPAVSASAARACGVGLQCPFPRALRRAGERHDLRLRPGRQRDPVRGCQVRVGLGRAPHGLRRVVDQDVERSLGGHLVGQRHHLARIAQVDPHHAQPVQPVRAVLHRAEAAHRVVREARGDRRVRAVAQQPQRDVHADLRAPAGQQRAAAGQVGPGVAARVVERRAGGTELVVEGVDLAVALLADVTRARLDQHAAAAPANAAARRWSRRRCGRAPRSRWRP